ncbi:MAG: aldo/keto reductase [Phycisphaerae bacterium]|jgi:aryl-alcohol dehydrogenase-like predicted oxidoreductase|nr:aldo/keto reductase [Phycisphaerae bacterium]
MRIGRREFMESLAVGTASLAIGCSEVVSSKPRVALSPMFDPYETVTIGRTKVETSLVGLGTGMRGWMRKSDQTRLGQEGFTKLIRGALERGVRCFDLADLYGSHPFFAKALKGVKRSEYTTLTKIWWKPKGVPDKDRPDADVMVGRFIKELQTDYIDVVQLHCVTSAKWPENLRKQMDLLEALKRKGVIRAHGVSCHSLEALAAAAAEPWTDCVHARINPYGERTDGTNEQIEAAVKKLCASGKGVIGMKIMGQGAFRDSDEKRDKSINFVLSMGAVNTMVVGFEKLGEIDDFAARVRKVKRPAVSA